MESCVWWSGDGGRFGSCHQGNGSSITYCSRGIMSRIMLNTDRNPCVRTKLRYMKHKIINNARDLLLINLNQNSNATHFIPRNLNRRFSDIPVRNNKYFPAFRESVGRARNNRSVRGGGDGRRGLNCRVWRYFNRHQPFYFGRPSV